jgi:pantothenate kinase
VTPDLPSLVVRAEALVGDSPRRLLGLAGPPGAGKSTLAQALVTALAARRPGAAVLVPMDGWHLRQAELLRRGLAGRKGAPDTFDAAGFVSMLRRLRARTDVRAPIFDRTRGDVVDDAVRVPPAARLVVVEGSYLLLDDGAWAGVRPLLDEVWYLCADDAVRRSRLVRRHVAGGRAAADAEAFVVGSDEVNARLVAATRGRADLVVSL